MSEPVPDRPVEDGAERTSRPAPPGYGVAAEPSGPPVPPPAAPPAPPAPRVPTAGTSPYYGRVPRFGAAPTPPGSSSPPPSPQPAQAPQVPNAAYAPVPAAGWVPGAEGPTWSPVPPGPPVGPAPYAPGRRDYAPWLCRVVALVVDHLPSYVASVLLLASYVLLYAALLRGDFTARPTWGLYTAGILLSVAALGFTVWNRWVLAGRTGQSLGKRLTHVWLVGEADGRPVGVLTAFLRDLLHVLDSGSHVGYLWPLWDDQHQTLADKVARTVVVTTPVPPLPRA